MRPMLRSAACLTVIVGLAHGLSACAVTSADGRRMSPRSDAFADYVEAVFRRQNEVSGELAFALDELDVDTNLYSGCPQ